MRRLFATVLVLVLTAPAMSKIKTLPLTELTASAELIVIAEVVSISEDLARSLGAPIRNELRVTRVLKGSHDASRPLVLATHFKPGDKAREDSLVLPAQGRRVLLFLKAGPDKRLRTVNGIQGSWPLEPGTDKTLGMGFRYSVADVEKLIAAQKR
jgi:hypothetical protein